MGFGTPGVNLHAPGPIGDATPSTLAGTTLNLASASTQITVLNGSVSALTITNDGFSDVTYNLTGAGGNYFHFFQCNSSTVLFIGPNQFGASNGAAFKLGNVAASAGVAGTLAATTDHSLTVLDANGTTYKIPCIAA